MGRSASARGRPGLLSDPSRHRFWGLATVDGESADTADGTEGRPARAAETGERYGSDRSGTSCGDTSDGCGELADWYESVALTGLAADNLDTCIVHFPVNFGTEVKLRNQSCEYVCLISCAHCCKRIPLATSPSLTGQSHTAALRRPGRPSTSLTFVRYTSQHLVVEAERVGIAQHVQPDLRSGICRLHLEKVKQASIKPAKLFKRFESVTTVNNKI